MNSDDVSELPPPEQNSWLRHWTLLINLLT